MYVLKYIILQLINSYKTKPSPNHSKPSYLNSGKFWIALLVVSLVLDGRRIVLSHIVLLPKVSTGVVVGTHKRFWDGFFFAIALYGEIQCSQ